VALTLPAIVTSSQVGHSPVSSVDAATDPKGLSSGEMSAPVAPELTPGQDGQPSKRSEDVPPAPSPAPGADPAPAGNVDTFFADEGAVALLAGQDSLPVLGGEGDVTRAVGGPGFAMLALGGMFGRCWLESDADAERRRTQDRSFRR